MPAIPLAVKRFLQAEEGPTAVEYAVLLALIIFFCPIDRWWQAMWR